LNSNLKILFSCIKLSNDILNRSRRGALFYAALAACSKAIAWVCRNIVCETTFSIKTLGYRNFIPSKSFCIGVLFHRILTPPNPQLRFFTTYSTSGAFEAILKLHFAWSEIISISNSWNDPQKHIFFHMNAFFFFMAAVDLEEENFFWR
jgi:hypothetical protein